MSTTTHRGWTVTRTLDETADNGERVTIVCDYDGETITTDGVEDAAYVLAYVLTVDHGEDDFTNASTLAVLFAGDAMASTLETAWQGCYDAQDDAHGSGASLVKTHAALLATR